MKGLMIAAMLWAAAGSTPAASVGADADDPTALVRTLYRTWVQTAKQRREELVNDRQLLYRLTEEATTPYIDFERLARLVLGKHWRQASPEQRRRFVREFRTHLVRTYAVAMFKYIDAQFVFKPARVGRSGGPVVVRTETIPKGGRRRFPVNYVVYRTEGGAWKAMDVTIDGVSVVATLRNIVRSEIAAKGLDAVIEELAAKNRQAAK